MIIMIEQTCECIFLHICELTCVFCFYFL